MAKRKLNFNHSDENLKKQLKGFLAYDLSLLFPNLVDDEKKRLLSIIEITKITDIFAELVVEEQQDLLRCLTKSKQGEFFKSVQTDDLKEFIESLEAEEQETIIKLLPVVKAKTIRLLLTYHQDLAASIMTTDFLTISKETSIKDATAKIIAISKEQDYIDTIFVIDDKMIVGIIDLKQLIIARSTDHLEDIMVEDFHFVYEDESIEKAIQTIKDYDRNVIPVLSREDHLMGIVTADDIFDEIIESHDEDYHKLALVHDHDIDDSAFKRSSQRLPWLMIAVVLNLLIASFLSIFEATLAEVTALVLFQPLIMGMAGNIGTQSLAVTLLGLHLEELDNKKMPKKYIIKETFVGLFNSLSLGIASFIVAYGFLLLIPTGSQRGFDVAFIVFIAVFASMFISAIMGVLIPLTLNRLKVDPAVASGPIMTTINDVVALVIYFGIATIAFML